MNETIREPRELGRLRVDYKPKDEFVVDKPKDDLIVDMASLTKEIMTFNDPLTSIAERKQALTYGEMIDLANGIWNARLESETTITAENLAAILHRWSKQHISKVT